MANKYVVVALSIARPALFQILIVYHAQAI